MNRVKGFTLTEIIVVIAIITVLAGLVFSVAGTARRQGMINATKQEIQLLEQTLRQYYEDMYEYPGNGNAALVDCLTNSQISAAGGNWHGPYFDFDDDRLNANNEFLDLWGRKYEYQVTAGFGDTMHNSSFDLWSQGLKESDDSDDITNW